MAEACPAQVRETCLPHGNIRLKKKLSDIFLSLRDPNSPRPKWQGLSWIIIAFLLTGVPVIVGRGIAAHYHLSGDMGKTIVLPFVILILFALQKEQGREIMARHIPALLLAGIAPAALWIAMQGEFSLDENGVVLSEVPWLVFANYFLNSIVIVPVYEEKIVRGLLLRGAAAFLSRPLAIFATSALFAYAHKGDEISSFLFAIVLAYLALYRNMGAIERAIIHGSYNATIAFAAAIHIVFMMKA